jgi:hypothetical protein
MNDNFNNIKLQNKITKKEREEKESKNKEEKGKEVLKYDRT